MRKNKGAVLGLTIIIAALGFSALTFKGSLVNYVPFAEARQATDATVQIMGAPVSGTMGYDNGLLHFALRDDGGQIMPVAFQGPKPEDMDTAMSKATKITAQGTYDPRRRVFVAENLLVKCPSKYQGQSAGGSGERKYGSS